MKEQLFDKIYQGDAREILKKIPSEFANCCVTSPPYYGLRDYKIKGQIGLEKTPEEYIEKLVCVFREVKRILKKDGTLWVNIGDCYAGSGGCGSKEYHEKKHTQFGKPDRNPMKYQPPKKIEISIRNLKPKDLIGIPWMLAFALRTDGWYLRQDIIWSKPNPMPESVKDRCTKSHEYVFLLSKSRQYYFDNDSIKENTITNDNSNRDRDNSKLNNTPGRTRMGGLIKNNYEYRNKRSVWEINTKPFNESHFATFPPKLIEPMILAGCPRDGIIIDPFSGAGTTGLVSKKLNRHYILIDINPEYCEMENRRINGELFKQEIL